jgi:hypothetical protein
MSFIQFHTDTHTEVLRLSKDGIWANPDIPVDEAAKLVLAAIDHNIKVLVDKAILAEREACAKVAEDKGAMVQALLNVTSQPIAIAAAIRARGNT